MRNKEGFLARRHLQYQASYCSLGRRGQRFRGKDLSGGGTHPRSLERDERSRWYRESTAKDAERSLNESFSGAAREGSQDKKGKRAAAFYRLNVVAR